MGFFDAFWGLAALAFYVCGLLAYGSKFDGNGAELLCRFLGSWLLLIIGLACLRLGGLR